MRNLSDSRHYFFTTQWAGLQLQGTIHAQVTEEKDKHQLGQYFKSTADSM